MPVTWLSFLVLTEPADSAVPSPQSIVADVLSILPTTSENDAPSTGSISSYAPMSQLVPCGRLMSRWSVVFVQLDALDGIASTAGLPADSGSTSVLPPMSRTPVNRNCGSVFWRSPVAVKPQSEAVSMLWP